MKKQIFFGIVLIMGLLGTDVGYPASPRYDATGRWDITRSNFVNGCPESIPFPQQSRICVIQSGTSVTEVDLKDQRSVTGTVSGATYTLQDEWDGYSGSITETTTITLSSATEGSGTDNWTYSKPGLSCSGHNHLSLTKLPQSPAIYDATGNWRYTTFNPSTSCAPAETPPKEGTFSITQIGNRVTAATLIGKQKVQYQGYLSGSTYTLMRSSPDAGGTVSQVITLTLSDSGSGSGSFEWVWNNASDNCGGTVSILVTRILTISASAGSGGSISPSGSVSAPYNGNLTFTISPNAGYRVQDVRVDGVSVGAVGSYTFANVQSNHEIKAVFKPIPPLMPWLELLLLGETPMPTTPTIALSRASVGFTATVGGGTPASQQVTITNGGGGSLTGVGKTISYGAGQPTGWLTATFDTTTAPANLTLQATTGSLAAGTYNVNVAVTSAVASNSPQNIAVTFTVTSSSSGLVLDVPTVSGTQITLTWSYTWPSLGSSNDAYLLEESTTSSSSGFVQIMSIDQSSGHVSPYTEILTRSAGTYYYRVRARTVLGLTPYSEVRSAIVETEPRKITIVNKIDAGLNLQQVVQVKVSLNTGFGHADLLTDDPAHCLSLPGEAIDQGESKTFDITIGDNYNVFIGIGLWDFDNVLCSYLDPWFKRCYFTDPDFNTYYVWAVVQVGGHISGNWAWTITGSYLTGTLKVTPAGKQAILFNVTNNNPIP